jgi:hypothetical protein
LVSRVRMPIFGPDPPWPASARAAAAGMVGGGGPRAGPGVVGRERGIGRGSDGTAGRRIGDAGPDDDAAEGSRCDDRERR